MWLGETVRSARELVYANLAVRKAISLEGRIRQFGGALGWGNKFEPAGTQLIFPFFYFLKNSASIPLELLGQSILDRMHFSNNFISHLQHPPVIPPAYK